MILYFLNLDISEILSFQKSVISLSDEDIQKIRETQTKNREENLKQNRFWLNQLSAYYRNGTDLETFYDREKLTENVNSKDLQAAANKYLNMDNYVKVVLMPEE